MKETKMNKDCGLGQSEGDFYVLQIQDKFSLFYNFQELLHWDHFSCFQSQFYLHIEYWTIKVTVLTNSH